MLFQAYALLDFESVFFHLTQMVVAQIAAIGSAVHGACDVVVGRFVILSPAAAFTLGVAVDSHRSDLSFVWLRFLLKNHCTLFVCRP